MTKTLAEELRRIRGVLGYSLRTVEDRTKISNAYLSQLESGKAANPSPHILHKLAECYGVPYEELMKAAGYIERTPQSSGRIGKRVSALQAALMSAGLDEEEEKKAAEYIEFLRLQRRHQDK